MLFGGGGGISLCVHKTPTYKQLHMKKGKLTVTAWFKPDDPQSVMHTKIFLENFYKHYLLYVFKN